MLDSISIEDKAAAFDALVKEFQGMGRFVHMKRRPKEVKTGPNETVIVAEDYPVYEFVMRVEGHDDFAAAVLKLLPANARGNGLSPEATGNMSNDQRQSR